VTYDELDAALEQAPRKSVYLFGQVDDEQVSMVGERGALVVQTSSSSSGRVMTAGARSKLH
jgi:hypothetical protein